MAKKKTDETETEVQVGKSATGTTVATVADDDIDMAADAGAGQNFEAEDLPIPRIGIIQSLSPQRQKTKPEYIDGAEEGMFFESLSKRLYAGDKGILVIPLFFHKIYLEWSTDRSKGLVKNHGEDRTAYDAYPQDEKTGKHTKDGNFIQPTAEYFVLLVDEATGMFSPAVMSMASVFMKQAKRWNGLINLMRITDKLTKRILAPAIFYSTYKITAVPESNENGSWFRHEISAYKPLVEQGEDGKWNKDVFANGMSLYKEAKRIREQIISGKVKVADPQEETVSTGGASNETDEDPM